MFLYTGKHLMLG